MYKCFFSVSVIFSDIFIPWSGSFAQLIGATNPFPTDPLEDVRRIAFCALCTPLTAPDAWSVPHCGPMSFPFVTATQVII